MHPPPLDHLAHRLLLRLTRPQARRLSTPGALAASSASAAPRAA